MNSSPPSFADWLVLQRGLGAAHRPLGGGTLEHGCARLDRGSHHLPMVYLRRYLPGLTEQQLTVAAALRVGWRASLEELREPVVAVSMAVP